MLYFFGFEYPFLRNSTRENSIDFQCAKTTARKWKNVSFFFSVVHPDFSNKKEWWTAFDNFSRDGRDVKSRSSELYLRYAMHTSSIQINWRGIDERNSAAAAAAAAAAVAVCALALAVVAIGVI